MGAWNITIKGHGTHHNNRDDDANVMSRRLVESLKLAGHDVNEATFQLVVDGGDVATGPVEDLLSETSATVPPLPAPQG